MTRLKMDITKKIYDKLDDVNFNNVRFTLKSTGCTLVSGGEIEKDHHLIIEMEIAEENQMNIDNLATQTPEEKEALDNLPGIPRDHLLKMIKLQTETIKELSEELNSSESPNGSNDIAKPLWSNGDECLYLNSRECVFIGMRINSKTHCIIETKNSGTYMPVNIEEISKPETPQQREEREELADTACENMFGESIQNCRPDVAATVRCMIDAGYRKESK